MGLGDCLGTSVDETVAVGCSSTGEVLCGGTSQGDGADCPSRSTRPPKHFGGVADC